MDEEQESILAEYLESLIKTDGDKKQYRYMVNRLIAMYLSMQSDVLTKNCPDALQRDKQGKQAI